MLSVSSEAIRKIAGKVEYWSDYAFRLEHELGEALHRARCPNCGEMVGSTGIEPVTSAMSTRCSTSELAAQRDKTQTAGRQKPFKQKGNSRRTATMSTKRGQGKSSKTRAVR